jgi:hypothetical protein
VNFLPSKDEAISLIIKIRHLEMTSIIDRLVLVYLSTILNYSVVAIVTDLY